MGEVVAMIDLLNMRPRQGHFKRKPAQRFYVPEPKHGLRLHSPRVEQPESCDRSAEACAWMCFFCLLRKLVLLSRNIGTEDRSGFWLS